jgi:uncharacterized membrane protein YbhN (UPF0104 family)
MKLDILKKIKIFIPYFFLIIFLFLIYNFYKSNYSSFSFSQNFSFSIFFLIIILCFGYLITEALILKYILKYFNKNLNLLTSFFVMNTSYFFNTFLQFTGLGFRVFYLKKIHNIDISNFLILSLFVILIEFYIFSLIGSLFFIIMYFNDLDLPIQPYVKIIVHSINILTLIVLIFNEKIYGFAVTISYLKNFIIMKKISLFYQNNKKNLYLFFIKFIPFFFMQFFLLFFIFFLAASIFSPEQPISFAIITSIATDLSFIFTFTPQSIGISEVFVYYSSLNMGITFAQILFLINVFRLGTFCIYVIIGPIYFFLFFKTYCNK